MSTIASQMTAAKQRLRVADDAYSMWTERNPGKDPWKDEVGSRLATERDEASAALLALQQQG